MDCEIYVVVGVIFFIVELFVIVPIMMYLSK